MSDSVRPHRRQPTRLPCPWDSPGNNTGVGCHFLLQCMTMKSESEVAQSCPTLSDPMDCSPRGSSVHGIFQATVLEWGATAFSRVLIDHQNKKMFPQLWRKYRAHFDHFSWEANLPNSRHVQKERYWEPRSHCFSNDLWWFPHLHSSHPSWTLCMLLWWPGKMWKMAVDGKRTRNKVPSEKEKEL